MVYLTSTHSSQQANASSEKSSGISEETGRVNISEGPLTFKWLLTSASQERSEEQKEPGFAGTCAAAEMKERITWDKNKTPSTIDYLSALGSNWEWSQGSSIGLLLMVFRETDVI